MSQIDDIEGELRDAERRVHRLAEGFDEDSWNARPEPGRWSAAECVIHLNLTSEAFLPRIREAIADGRLRGITGQGPFRHGLAGFILQRTLEPPVRFRLPTGPTFVPQSGGSRADVLGRFDALQEQLVGAVRASEGLDIGRLKVESPFARRLRYSLYSSFRLIAAHQRRHLWQIEQVRPGGPT